MADLDEKYYPHNIAWIVLNRLKEFNDKPEFIRELNYRFNRLTTHTLYFKFAPFYEEAMKYFEKHNKFPGIKYFNERFTDGRVMLEMTNASFSMDMYDELKKQLDYELLIQDFNERIGHSDHIDIEGCKEFGKKFTLFAETGKPIPIDKKEDWLNSYEHFEQRYHGISTGIPILDEQIGDLNGLVTVAAPSGNGKSTFALSLAYNIATQKDDRGRGRNVLYISYEMTKFQLQANLVSIESSLNSDISKRLKATDIKESKLNEEQRQLYKDYIESFMTKTNQSGGYIALYDNTSMSGCSTIEEFMAKIEEYSASLERRFDVIFIDNVDSLKMLEGDRGQSEMDKVNTFITKLDSFTKTYMDGYGTTIVLLSQTNREGIDKLTRIFESKNNDKDKEVNIDGTVLKSFSSLYERATMVLVLYSSAVMRANNQLELMPVKLRNKPLPRKPINLATKWEYSYVGNYGASPIVINSQIPSSDDIDDIDDIQLEDIEDLYDEEI